MMSEKMTVRCRGNWELAPVAKVVERLAAGVPRDQELGRTLQASAEKLARADKPRGVAQAVLGVGSVNGRIRIKQVAYLLQPCGARLEDARAAVKLGQEYECPGCGKVRVA